MMSFVNSGLHTNSRLEKLTLEQCVFLLFRERISAPSASSEREALRVPCRDGLVRLLRPVLFELATNLGYGGLESLVILR